MTKELTIQKIVSPLVTKARELSIKKQEDMPVAVSMLSELNKASDRITEEREKVTAPLNQALKAERSRWKPMETALNEAISIVRSEISTYQTAAKKEADEKAAAIAARVKTGTGNLTAESAINKLAQIEKPEEFVATEVGEIKFMTVKRFEVMDMTLLPMEYHLVDEVAVRKAMKEGIKLPGVRYYTEESPINYR